MAKKWVALFSQTGGEINNIRKAIKRSPDIIITNRQDFEGVNKEFLEEFGDSVISIPKKPTLDDYLKVINDHKDIFEDCIITLHGYLRIVPRELCETYDIVNLHPGLITKYPELKGFNPQERAFEGKYATAGCVIHRVSPEVDEGEIVKSIEVSIKGLTLDQVYETLHDAGSDLWIEYFKENIVDSLK